MLKEKTEKCLIYARGEAKEVYFLGKLQIICPLKEKDCPYRKGLAVDWEGEPVTVCEPRGLLRKTELEGLGHLPAKQS